MAGGTPLKERLQPALLDRLIDQQPQNQAIEPREERLLTKARLRQAVLRDLAWLFNTTRMGGQALFGSCKEAERSVVNYGLPVLSGQTASTLDVLELEYAIKQAILDYEPRIVPSTLEVQTLTSEAWMDNHNTLSVQIKGTLWVQPISLELVLRTEVDLETGQIEIRDVG